MRTRPARLPTPTPPGPTPKWLTVDVVGLRIPVDPVGVVTEGRLAGQLELPPDPARIGWYRFGPAPSSAHGSVVVGGHLDSRRYGVGPLVRLRRVRPGATVTVEDSRGGIRRYRVTDVRRLAKRTLPVRELFDRDGPAKLQVVTCGGAFDRRRGGYQENLVVTARAVR